MPRRRTTVNVVLWSNAAVLSASGAQVFSRSGTPAIDGRMMPEEWTIATALEVLVNLPKGGTTPGQSWP